MSRAIGDGEIPTSFVDSLRTDDLLSERVRGIGPLSPPWQGGVLPLYYTRLRPP